MNNETPSIEISGQLAWQLLALANETETDLTKMVSRLLAESIQRERRKIARRNIREFSKRELAKLAN